MGSTIFSHHTSSSYLPTLATSASKFLSTGKLNANNSQMPALLAPQSPVCCEQQIHVNRHVPGSLQPNHANRHVPGSLQPTHVNRHVPGSLHPTAMCLDYYIQPLCAWITTSQASHPNTPDLTYLNHDTQNIVLQAHLF